MTAAPTRPATVVGAARGDGGDVEKTPTLDVDEVRASDVENGHVVAGERRQEDMQRDDRAVDRSHDDAEHRAADASAPPMDEDVNRPADEEVEDDDAVANYQNFHRQTTMPE